MVGDGAVFFQNHCALVRLQKGVCDEAQHIGRYGMHHQGKSFFQRRRRKKKLEVERKKEREFN